MSGKKATPIIGILFLVISGLAVYLFIRLRTLPPYVPPVVEVEKKIIATRPGDPISKSFIPEGGLFYEMDGVIAQDFTNDGGKFSTGTFIVEGDPLNREITVFTGLTDGNIFLGTYERSFDATSTWERVSTVKALELLEKGRPLRVRVKLPLIEGIGGSTVEYVKEREEIIDDIIRELRSGKYVLQIPEGFFLYAGAVGVIK